MATENTTNNTTNSTTNHVPSHDTFLRSHDYLICLVGKSGSGKDTIQEQVCKVPFIIYDKKTGTESIKYLQPVISYTTRPRRKGEHNTHQFVAIENKPNKTEMAAYTQYYGYEYWATWKQLDNSNIYIIDPKGVKYLKETTSKIKGLLHKDLYIIYLDVSWWRRLIRLTKRNSIFYAIKRIVNDCKAFRKAKKIADITLKNHSRANKLNICNYILNIFEGENQKSELQILSHIYLN